jgi:hypothetical protein
MDEAVMAKVIELYIRRDLRWVMAKVIAFYKRRDWEPKREWALAGHNAKVIMFPTTSKKSAQPGWGNRPPQLVND